MYGDLSVSGAMALDGKSRRTDKRKVVRSVTSLLPSRQILAIERSEGTQQVNCAPSGIKVRINLLSARGGSVDSRLLRGQRMSVVSNTDVSVTTKIFIQRRFHLGSGSDRP